MKRVCLSKGTFSSKNTIFEKIVNTTESWRSHPRQRIYYFIFIDKVGRVCFQRLKTRYRSEKQTRPTSRLPTSKAFKAQSERQRRLLTGFALN